MDLFYKLENKILFLSIKDGKYHYDLMSFIIKTKLKN
jgi:hypothetical protein